MNKAMWNSEMEDSDVEYVDMEILSDEKNFK